ncbi:hypothetical protein FB451DRAFT_1500544 [Mycena latifolia]|nr:hypothetical protein FB451DRAFT_1500544 [Mycena latifolia]
MQIPFSVLFAIFLALPTFAAPVPNAPVGDAFGLVARVPLKKVVSKKPLSKSKAPIPPKKPAAKPVTKTSKKAPTKVKPLKKPPVSKAPISKTPPTSKKPLGTKAPVAKPPAKPVSKTPTKPPVAKPPVTKPPVKGGASKAGKAAVASKCKGKPTTGKAPTAAKGKTATAKKGKAVKKPAKSRSIMGRAVSHPDAERRITLFHGTSVAGLQGLLPPKKVDLGKTAKFGDFNHSPEVPGGFYMTDSLVAAAQFACFEENQFSPSEVEVVEYVWDGTGREITNFAAQDSAWLNFVNLNLGTAVGTPVTDENSLDIYDVSAMVSGPLNGASDEDLTDSFFQYAVIDQGSADDGLTFVTHHGPIACANVPKGNDLTDAIYAKGQKTSSGFASQLAELLEPAVCEL